MQLRDLSVSKKIWLLVLGALALTMIAGFSMTLYLGRVDANLRTELQDYEQRIRVAEKWRGVTELSVGYTVLGAMTTEDELTLFTQGKAKVGNTEAAALQQQLEQQLTSPEGRAQLKLIADAHGKVLEVEAAVTKLRAGAQYSAARELLNQQLLPAMEVYSKAQIDLVALQERMRDRMLEQGQAQRAQAMLVGSGVLAAVVLLGLWLSILVVRQITAPLDQAVRLADTIAAGDLTVDVHDSRQDEFGHLLRSLSQMNQRLRDVVAQVRHGVDAVSSASSQIATGNQDLSSRTEQTASNLEETAASIEELTATVSQSADTARQANQLASTAVQAAERGGHVVEQVVASMQQISSSSHKISDIIGVIDGIAFQTNILALNAAVEAARAGEQGRGFAVVAAEVRSLAQRSAEAAKEIKALISASVGNVDTGSAQVAQAGESMHEIVASVRRVTDLIGEITAATQEQQDGFVQVNQAVSNLDQMTQQNAALVEESSAAATSMNEQAQRLAQVVAVFNVGHMAAAQQVTRAVAPSAPAPTTARAFKARVAASKSAGLKRPEAAKTGAETGSAETGKLLRPTASSMAAQSTADDWESF